jgi:hypothetical protein
MLYVVLNHQTKSEKEVTWHVGTKLDLQSTDLMDVDFVQADGDELEFLRTKFPALKIGSGRVEKLTGNQAMEAAALLLAKV